MGCEQVRITCKSTNATPQIESTYKQNLKLTTSKETELTPVLFRWKTKTELLTSPKRIGGKSI